MDTDKKLVKDAQRDIKQFGNIYESYFKKIKNYFRPKVSNDEFTAEDLTSQTFEKAIKNINRFKWQGNSFSSWLYKIANNTLIDFYRKNKEPVNVSEEFYNNIRDNTKLIEESAIERDTNKRIKAILAELPEREAEAVRLKFYEGLGNKEIAEKLNLSETNIGTIIYRTMKKLKETFEDSQLKSGA